MNKLFEIAALVRADQAAGPLTEARYGEWHFGLLGRGEAPFDPGTRPGRRIPASLELCWRHSVASYQLCAFHAVNVTTRGAAFAERILRLQARFLDGLEAGAGEPYLAETRKLYAMVSQPLHVPTREGGLMEIPVDWRVAIDFLLTSPESPFKTDQESFSSAGAPTFPDDLDALLAEDLERAWNRASAHFQRLAQAVA